MHTNDLESAQTTPLQESPSPDDCRPAVATVPETDKPPVAYVSEPKPETDSPAAQPNVAQQSAGRPHLITIALGLVSPAIALVALFISFKSIRIAVDSQKIAQRAYVTADLSAHEEQFLLKGQSKTERPFLRIWHVSVDLRNTGNTPATILLTKVTQDEIDKGYKFDIHRDKDEELFVNGKDKTTIDVASLTVNDKMAEASHLAILLPTLEVEFRYSDVFDDDHPRFMVCTSRFLEEKLESRCQNYANGDAPKRPSGSSLFPLGR
jgi:hypothetical protein